MSDSTLYKTHNYAFEKKNVGMIRIEVLEKLSLDTNTAPKFVAIPHLFNFRVRDEFTKQATSLEEALNSCIEGLNDIKDFNTILIK